MPAMFHIYDCLLGLQPNSSVNWDLNSTCSAYSPTAALIGIWTALASTCNCMQVYSSFLHWCVAQLGMDTLISGAGHHCRQKTTACKSPALIWLNFWSLNPLRHPEQPLVSLQHWFDWTFWSLNPLRHPVMYLSKILFLFYNAIATGE